MCCCERGECHHGNRHHGHDCKCRSDCECEAGGECGCRAEHGEHGGCCRDGGHHGFRRCFKSKAETIAELESYMAALKAEAQAVEERLNELRG
jgi:hypothetical protein